MCFGGGGGIDQSLNIQAAALTREQYDDYVNRFQPIESTVLEGIMGEDATLGNPAVMDEALGRASGDVNRQYNVAEGATDRNFGRLGVDMTAEREAVAGRGLAMGKTLSEVSARNNTRTAVDDRNLSTAQNMVSLGRGIAADANSMYGANAAMETSRNANNAAMKQQQRANTVSGITGLAGIGLGIAAL